MDSLIILTLSRVKGIGNKRIYLFYDLFDSYVFQDLITLFNDLLQLINQLKLNIEINYEQICLYYEEAKSVLEHCDEMHISVLNFTDDRFPSRLKKIDNPPALLFCKGNLDLLKRDRLIAVVGSRNLTDIALKLGSRLVERFLEEKFVIVSGLAIGSDYIAHKTALSGKGETIAVLPSGLENIYPELNNKLANQIIDDNGLLLTEYTPGSEAKRSMFLERNRIVSGLSLGVAIIQCEKKSGTMETVKLAKKQKKKIAAIDYSFMKSNDVRFDGNRFLISNDIAVPLDSVESILKFSQEITSNLQ